MSKQPLVKTTVGRLGGFELEFALERLVGVVGCGGFAGPLSARSSEASCSVGLTFSAGALVLRRRSAWMSSSGIGVAPKRSTLSPAAAFASLAASSQERLFASPAARAARTTSPAPVTS